MRRRALKLTLCLITLLSFPNTHPFCSPFLSPLSACAEMGRWSVCQRKKVTSRTPPSLQFLLAFVPTTKCRFRLCPSCWNQEPYVCGCSLFPMTWCCGGFLRRLRHWFSWVRVRARACVCVSLWSVSEQQMFRAVIKPRWCHVEMTESRHLFMWKRPKCQRSNWCGFFLLLVLHLKKKKKLFMSALDMCCHGYGQGFTVEIIIFVHQDGGDSFRTAQLKIDHIRSIFYADVLKQNILVCLL